METDACIIVYSDDGIAVNALIIVQCMRTLL